MAGPDPETWSALLARWVEFARAALALPDTDEGTRWRASVPAIITLQAVTHALGEVDRLPAPERGLALDRAGVLIRENEESVRLLWEAEGLPERLRELVDDARAMHAVEARRQGRPGGG